LHNMSTSERRDFATSVSKEAYKKSMIPTDDRQVM
jgi:hypothetical protein